MDEHLVKTMFSLSTGNLMVTSFVAAFLCEKNGIDKAELVAYLRKCKEINVDDFKDETLAASFSDSLEKVASTLEALHKPLDDSNTSLPKH